MNYELVANKVFLMGTVEKEPVYSHSVYGEGFHEFILRVPRLSDQADYLPVTVSERLMGEAGLKVGDKLALNGHFRSFNKIIGEKSKLMLTVFVKEFVPIEEDINPNSVELSGHLCKPPIYRITPFNREICDLLLAVNRAYGKSDYIPCIAWGRNARFLKTSEVGQKLTVCGRIQSRDYNKKISETETIVLTAYELSVNKIFIDG